MSAALPELRRVNRGGGHSYLLDGEPIPGVTTILSKGYPKPALIHWAADESAKYVLNYWDELVEMKPAERYKEVLWARNTARDAAAGKGTKIHGYAVRLARGEDVDVPEDLIGHVDAYLAFANEWKPKELLVEAPVVSLRWRYAGTLDLVAKLADGLTWLLDYKTSGKGVFPDNACQVAAYRHADYYLNELGKLRKMPKVDRAGIVWLRADGFDLVPVDAGEQTFRVFLHSLGIARFIDRAEDVGIVGETLVPPQPEGVPA